MLVCLFCYCFAVLFLLLLVFLLVFFWSVEGSYSTGRNSLVSNEVHDYKMIFNPHSNPDGIIGFFFGHRSNDTYHDADISSCCFLKLSLPEPSFSEYVLWITGIFK